MRKISLKQKGKANYEHKNGKYIVNTLNLFTSQQSIADFNAINKGLGSLKDNVAKDIFNGMCAYLANVFIEYPQLYELFNKNFEKMKQNKNKDE